MTAADGAGAWRRYEVRPRRARRGRARGDAARCASSPNSSRAVGVGVALTKAGSTRSWPSCTELGVARIEPFRSGPQRRAVGRGPAPRPRVRGCATIVREAAAQCRRARLPEVAARGRARAISRAAPRPRARRSRRASRRPSSTPPGPSGWTVLVGPEGGFAPDEQAGLGAGVARLALGPHVLRAETAPIAAAAVLAAGCPVVPVCDKG